MSLSDRSWDRAGGHLGAQPTVAEGFTLSAAYLPLAQVKAFIYRDMSCQISPVFESESGPNVM